MGYLYKLDFEGGKSYIGITTKGVEHRFNKHRLSAIGGSSLAVHRAWRVHGAPEKSILAILEDDELASAEIKAIKAYNTLAPNGYNLSLGGETSPMRNPYVAAKMLGNKHSLGVFPSAETRAKLSAARIGKKLSPETRAKVSEARMGMKFSKETKARISASKSGVRQSIESVLKRSASLKGHKVSESTREKISNALKGKPLSEETKMKLSVANKGQGVGRTFSLETREKLSIAAKQREQKKRELEAVGEEGPALGTVGAE